MKLKTVKKRFIKSRKNYSICPVKAEELGVEFWKESLSTLKSIFWKNGKFKSTPNYMIDFCSRTNELRGKKLSLSRSTVFKEYVADGEFEKFTGTSSDEF